MCTVTFLPLGKQSYILTSNRDEWSGRKSALPPQPYSIAGEEVFFPKDQEAGGTWIAIGTKALTLCLLNGAFVPHQRKLPYRLSRGLMVLEVFKYGGLRSFHDSFDFTGIEPFTLVSVELQYELKLFELRWDGEKTHFTELDSRIPVIWSSASLYTSEVIEQRKHWFSSWLEKPTEFTQENILHFHRFTGDGDAQNDLIMVRENGVMTQSITSVFRNDQQLLINHRDLLSNTDHIIERK